MAEFFNLDISLIDEDPDQPRRGGNAGFSEKSLNELAVTNIERGVMAENSVGKGRNGRDCVN